MDDRVTELHCIMPIGNIQSILMHGILSHEKAKKLPSHQSVAMQEVQDRRDVKTVPKGLKLHQYANLYFHARNPMLYLRQDQDVCVLRVSTRVLAFTGAVITDQNAASNYARFLSPTQMDVLNFDAIYARDWNHPNNQALAWRRKSEKCAEVLVPGSIPPEWLIGAYVPDEPTSVRLMAAGFNLPIVIDPDFFFG